MARKPGEPRRSGDRFLAHRALIAAACGTAMSEAVLLVLLAPTARALAPQVTALPPLAVFHDLRWLYGVQRSWFTFCLLLAGLVLTRSAVNAVMVRLAWPAGLPSPAPLMALGRALAVTAFALVVMSPIVSVTFGVAILPFSWPFLAMLPAMLLISLPLSHAGMAAHWWRALPPPSAVGWLLTEFAVLSAAAALAGAFPPVMTVPVAGLAGLLNARAWYGVTGAVARPAARVASGVTGRWAWHPLGRSFRLVSHHPAQRVLRLVPHHGPPDWVPTAPLALAVAITVVIAATRLVFLLNAVQPSPAPDGDRQVPVTAATGLGGGQRAALRTSGQGDPVLVIAGFGSSCCTRDSSLAKAMPGAFVRQFSYLGLSRTGQPLPYGPSAGNVPLPLLGDRIAAQVRRLYWHTHHRVDVVAESEGTLGVDAMLALHPDVPVGSVALLSPIVAPGQVRYASVTGPGLVAGGELHAVVWFVGGLSPFGSAGAQRFIDSVNNVGARFATLAARRLPLRVLELVPLADAVTLPACQLPSNVLVVPALHGRLLGDPGALRMVAAFLRHRPVRSIPALRTTAEIVAAAASAWRMPEPSTPTPPCRA